VELQLHCGCTSLKVAKPGYLLELLGTEATIADAERRMICRKCGKRPRIKLGLEWGVGGTRDRRKNPPPLPGWVKAMLGE
jgi:hypothetical protein